MSKNAPLITTKVVSGVLRGTVKAATPTPNRMPVSTKKIVRFLTKIFLSVLQMHNVPGAG